MPSKALSKFASRGDIIFNLLLLTGFILVLTALYSFGYLLFSLAFARKLRVLKSFDSYFSNFVLVGLILVSSIMVTSMLTSALHIPNFAGINFLVALLICSAITHHQPSDKSRIKFFTSSDIIGVVVALIVPLIILAIQLSSGSLNEALYRMVDANGRDRVAHFNMVQLNSENNNYIYSTSPLGDGKDAVYTNYPQGWHLASANVVDGFTPGVFDPNTYGYSASFIAYMTIIFSWFALAVFVFVKLTSHIAQSFTRKMTKTQHAFALAGVTALPTLCLFGVSLSYGFDNYIGLSLYVMLIVAMSHDLLTDKSIFQLRAYLVLSLLFATAAFLTWVLVIPILLAIIAISCIAATGLKQTVRSFLSPFVLVSSGLYFVAALLYASVFLQTSSGEAILWTDWIKTLPSPLFTLACLGVAVLVGSFAYKKTQKRALFFFFLFFRR